MSSEAQPVLKQPQTRTRKVSRVCDFLFSSILFISFFVVDSTEIFFTIDNNFLSDRTEIEFLFGGFRQLKECVENFRKYYKFDNDLTNTGTFCD